LKNARALGQSADFKSRTKFEPIRPSASGSQGIIERFHSHFEKNFIRRLHSIFQRLMK
jgi:hypothetical protein